MRYTHLTRRSGTVLAVYFRVRPANWSKENDVMIRYVCVAILLASVIAGCKDLGPTVMPNTTNVPQTAGKFFVDAFAVACSAKVNPRNDSLQAYFPFTLQYHFEGSPGSLNMMRIVFDRHLTFQTNSDGPFPDSIAGPCSVSWGFWTTSSLAQLDSVMVECQLEGAYCARVNGEQHYTGSFNWSAARKIPVYH
jgi:hypothetical protein